VDDLLTIWSLSNRVIFDSKHQIDAILAVVAVAIRRVITICENDEMEGIENLNSLPLPDLFTQFVLHPKKSQEFMFQHWDAAYQ
jgi:hypothetical protein